ncbi:MAG: heavy-metal-associated domain-containing protein [Elusimicrobiota bacterium]
MKEITLKIKGLKCSGCENSLEKALLAVEGICSAAASHTNGEVKVIFEEKKISIDLIEKTIKKNGREVIK